jgi:hypothetical protein
VATVPTVAATMVDVSTMVKSVSISRAAQPQKIDGGVRACLSCGVAREYADCVGNN